MKYPKRFLNTFPKAMTMEEIEYSLMRQTQIFGSNEYDTYLYQKEQDKKERLESKKWQNRLYSFMINILDSVKQKS